MDKSRPTSARVLLMYRWLCHEHPQAHQQRRQAWNLTPGGNLFPLMRSWPSR